MSAVSKYLIPDDETRPITSYSIHYQDHCASDWQTARGILVNIYVAVDQGKDSQSRMIKYKSEVFSRDRSFAVTGQLVLLVRYKANNWAEVKIGDRYETWWSTKYVKPVAETPVSGWGPFKVSQCEEYVTIEFQGKTFRKLSGLSKAKPGDEVRITGYTSKSVFIRADNYAFETWFCDEWQDVYVHDTGRDMLRLFHEGNVYCKLKQNSSVEPG